MQEHAFPWLALAALLPLQAAAADVPVPASHIPPSVIAELRSLEARFDQALAQDCSSDRCFSKGCIYLDHIVIDKPRTTSLPGLGEPTGPGGVEPQEYLTRARCELAHERAVSSRNIAALKERLSRKLSKGWLTVSVTSQVLSPIPQALSEPRPEPEHEPASEKQAPIVPEEPTEWDSKVAVRELWVSVLPYIPWMITLGLCTLAALILVWGFRRLGTESLEEKLLATQLQDGAAGEVPGGDETPAEPAEPAAPEENELALEEDPYITTQRTKWAERIAAAQLDKESDVLGDLLRDWLEAGQFAMLAKAVLQFSEQLTEAFPADEALAMRKLEFVEYLQGLDESTLPSEEEFFRKLNHHAISSSLLAQSDTEIYRSLREDFGPAGVVDIINNTPPRFGALFFALSTPESRLEVAGLLRPETRVAVARELLQSSRMSNAEVAHVFETLRAARTGETLPSPPAETGISDHGRPIDSAGSLSALLPAIEDETRAELFREALRRSSGTLPRWYESILYPEMLLRIPVELRADMLLDVDIRELCAWYSLRPAAWQQALLADVPDSIRGAMRGGMRFESRASQMALAEKGRKSLALALQKLLARGDIALADVIA